MKSTRDKIYELIKRSHDLGERGPSQAEIADAVGLMNPGTVGYHISRDPRMIQRGYRWIEIVEEGVDEITYTPTTTDRMACAFLDELGMNRERYNQLRAYAETIEPYTPPPTEDLDEDAPRYTFGNTGHTGALAYLCEIIESRRFDRADYARVMEGAEDE